MKVIEEGELNGMNNVNSGKDNSPNLDVFSTLMNIQNQQKLQKSQLQLPTNQYITDFPLTQDYSVNGFEDSNFDFVIFTHLTDILNYN